MSFGGFGKNSGPTIPPRAQSPFGNFPRPHSPSPSATTSFPESSVAQQTPSPRTFGALPFDNARQATGPPHPSASSSRPASTRLDGRQSSLAGEFGGPSQKRSPPFGPHDMETSMSSKISRFQDLPRTRSRVQYDDDFLADPGRGIKERPAPSRLDGRQSLLTGDFGNPSQKRSPPFGAHGVGTNMSSKISRVQDLPRARSPVQYNDDFLADPGSDSMDDNAGIGSNLHGYVAPRRNHAPSSAVASNMDPSPLWGDLQRPALSPHQWRAPGRRNTSFPDERSISATKVIDTQQSKELPSSKNEILASSNVSQDASRRPFSSPPKSRSGTAALTFQNNQRSSLSADGMKDDSYLKKPVSHSDPNRNRSPPAAAAREISLTSSYTAEDEAERELQAKAKRLARFKTELDEVQPGVSVHYGPRVPKKIISSAKTDQSSMEKRKYSSQNLSGSVEDMSQDMDDEDLQSSSIIVGLCPDMCPESERAERERKGDLDRYERLDGDRNQTSKTLAVKKYNRTAEREAELIRPMPILRKTMDYLLGLLDQPYDDRFLGLYNFLWDRMRAIRMDLRMQHIFNLEAITMLEQMIRLHVIVMHELCEFSKGEGFSEGFDAHLNIEQMNKTSAELFQLYDDHRKRGIYIPTEKEFRGYYALLKLDKHPGYKVEPAELSLDLSRMTAEIRQTHDVLFARDVARSCRTGNFIAFFRHARKASYLQACLMHAHFSKLRTLALASLHSGLQHNQGVPVARVSKWLGMEGEDIESLLQYHGYVLKEFEEPYMVKDGPFLNAEKDYPTRCSKLVERKKSDMIVEDVLSSHQSILFPSVSKKELQPEKKSKDKLAAVQPKQTKSSVTVSDEAMDMESVSSPRGSVQVQPLDTSRNLPVHPIDTSIQPLETSRIPQTASISSPKSNSVMPNVFVNIQSQNIQEQTSPVTSQADLLDVDGHESNYTTSPWNVSSPLVLPVNQPSYFDWTRESSSGGLNRSSPEKSADIVAHPHVKATEPEMMSANGVKWNAPAPVVVSNITSSLHGDVFMKEVVGKDFTDVQQIESEDVASYYDEEVVEAKLKLLLRLWKRRTARKREIREQNRLAANAAFSSLSLGPPIQHNKEKFMSCSKLDIDQAVSERYRKQQESWARWNVSELVYNELGEKSANSNCICWKLVSFSWLHSGDIVKEAKPHLSLDQWLQYKLIPAAGDHEFLEGLVMSAPGLAIWRRWGANHSGDIACCLSVIKDVQAGRFEKKLVGASAILFPLSETVSWELQKVQLHNLVMSLPTGAGVPLLILSGSREDNVAESSCGIVDKLGLKDIDKSRVDKFLVIFLNDAEDTAQFHGYFSDLKLKEGLMWLASQSRSQLALYQVTLRELAFSHLNLCFNALDIMGSDKVGPNQCISIFNESLDRSMKGIVTATNMNPIGWPCPEIFLLDDPSAELRAVRQFLPSLGWSSSEEVEPLISALRSCKLPSFSSDISFLSSGCSTGKDIEDQRQLLQDCLISYLTQSARVMNLMMATQEASVMLQKCTRLELHNTEYKVVPNWLLITRRVFNWKLHSLASISAKAYVLEQPKHCSGSLFLEKSEFEISAPQYAVHPSLDEMVQVSCSPIVSKRVRSPKTFQNASEIASVRDTDAHPMSSCFTVEENQCSLIQLQPVTDSDIYLKRNDIQLVPRAEKEADRLSQLLDRCNILQDEIEKKLSVYF